MSWFSMYAYIYIYMCVCVCVCVLDGRPHTLPSQVGDITTLTRWSILVQAYDVISKSEKGVLNSVNTSLFPPLAFLITHPLATQLHSITMLQLVGEKLFRSELVYTTNHMNMLNTIEWFGFLLNTSKPSFPIIIKKQTLSEWRRSRKWLYNKQKSKLQM